MGKEEGENKEMRLNKGKGRREGEGELRNIAGKDGGEWEENTQIRQAGG